MEVGWYWIVLEGEERGCGGVYHPWGNLILRRKPLQVSLNMPHTHPLQTLSHKRGRKFLRFICGEKMTILRHRANPLEACHAFIFPLLQIFKRSHSLKTLYLRFLLGIKTFLVLVLVANQDFEMGLIRPKKVIRSLVFPKQGRKMSRRLIRLEAVRIWTLIRFRFLIRLERPTHTESGDGATFLMLGAKKMLEGMHGCKS